MQLRISPADPGGSLLALSFPFSEALTRWVKTIPGREWKAAYKVWLVPNTPETLLYIRDNKPALVTLKIDPTVIERFRADVATLNAAHAHREAGDASIEHAWVTQPYAHQRAGLAMLVALHGCGALLWEMGLGKTKTAIDYCEYEAAKVSPAPFRVLVIAPNTVARNWGREIQLHAGHDDFVQLAGQPLAKRLEALGKARYTIVNCEALSQVAFTKFATARRWDVVIVDESTRFKNPRAARTKALLKLGKQAHRRIILTGTPITGSAEDAWSQMEFVSPGIFGSWYGFVDRFLERDFFKHVVGVRSDMVPELAKRIGARSYRVLKADVLDLPAKVYLERTVELTPEQRKAYDQMRDELRIALADERDITASNVLTQLLRLTQVTAGLIGERDAYQWLPDNAKVAELDNLLNDELKGEQVVIFGLYQKELEALAARYAGSTLVGTILGGVEVRQTVPQLPIIYGPTPERVRHELIEQFQAGKRRLLFAQIRTGGIGINLTAAKTAIYYSRSWSLEEYLQSQDRLHRIGQTGTVSIVSLIARGTIDEQISKALAAKQKLADRLTGDDRRRLIADVLGGK